MTTFWMKIVRGQRGQALVETAIAVPLLVLLVLGIVDFGKAYNYQNDLTHLANEAARYATVNACIPPAPPAIPPGPNPGCAWIKDAVKQDADTGELRNGSGSIAPPGVTISFCLPPGGDRIEAKATAVYRFSVFIHTFTKTMRTSATMYLEQHPASPNYTAPACP
jgi:TadE-like protein